VDMADLVRETLLPFADTSPKHRFEVDGLDDLPPVRGDRFRLGQVLTNLLSNAVKYSPDGGTVSISGHADKHQLEVSVRDEGIGMTPEQQTHLFEKFYRAATTVSGTGLGLAICKLIVEKHAGSVHAESEFGKGSTFRFTVPLVENQVTRSSISQA
jgi:two-component system sensor histidine kinase VicK